MGADIYLNSDYNMQINMAKPLFDAACAKRDKAKSQAARAAAQKEVEEHYEAMHAKGYFRDSYNGSSLFSVLGLSWWTLGDELLDDNRDLPIANAHKLLATLAGIDLRSRFDDWIAAKKGDGWNFDVGRGETSPDEWFAYFSDKKRDFEDLLKRSIELNEPLHWSV